MKVRPEPRITAPKLGDYMASPSASVRQRILRDQKITPDFQTARYRRAVGDIRAALVTSDSASAYLAKSAARLKSAKGVTDWQDTDNAVSAEAVEKFAQFLTKFDLKGLTFTRIGTYPVPIEGVEVSVYPIARVTRLNRDGSRSSGALLTVFRKDKSLAMSDRAGEVVADLLRGALESSGDKEVDRNLCIVVDVFRAKAFMAPKSNRKLRADIAATCREIAMLWPSIKAAETEVVATVVADLPLRSSEASGVSSATR
jgi:hypothetical protein